MSTFDLTPRLVRESKSNGKDTILFDKSLTGFGLRIHPSGRKVYIVQARIEGRSRVEATEKVGAIIATAMTSQRPRSISHRQ